MELNNLEKLNTKNLLAYYRAERKRYYVSISKFFWGIETDKYMWDHSDDKYYQKEKVKFDKWETYLTLIKKELGTREHI
jgi:hypothetical protein